MRQRFLFKKTAGSGYKFILLISFMKKIAITGLSGVIGSVLRKSLDEYDVLEIQHGNVDLREYVGLEALFNDREIVIHLAWDMQANPNDHVSFSGNEVMFENVYRASLRSGVKRVIMASSVHADDYYGYKGQDMMSVKKIPSPISPYGVQKVYMEALGNYYATKGLEVICIRFGDVNIENMAATHHQLEKAVFLSHDDLRSLIKASLDIDKVSNNFAVFYGVSDNENRIHDTSNPLGWVPIEKA